MSIQVILCIKAIFMYAKSYLTLTKIAYIQKFRCPVTKLDLTPSKYLTDEI